MRCSRTEEGYGRPTPGYEILNFSAHENYRKRLSRLSTYFQLKPRLETTHVQLYALIVRGID